MLYTQTYRTDDSDYSNVEEAWLTLGREAKERGLTPAAFPRTLGIVAPYTGL